MSSVLTVDSIVGKTAAANLKLPAGYVVQTVSVTDDTSQSITATTYTKSSLKLNITPKYNTSKIFVLATFQSYISTNGLTGYFAMFRDTTNLTDPQAFRLESGGGVWFGPASISVFDSPATTSSIEYSVQLRSQTSSLSTNIGLSASEGCITAMEIAQ